jgi:acyl-CoA synthetase (AMP-forming)/AMP-acid ligase II
LRPQALTPVYGLSEAALAVTISEPSRVALVRSFNREALARGHAEEQAGGRLLPSLGAPVPGCQLEIRDLGGVVLPAGRVGSVWIRSESLMEGYLGEPEETARVLVDGWLDSGDRGFLDGGELYLVGRVKDILVVNGRKFAPEDVEQAVSGLAGVADRCVVAATTKFAGAATESLVILVERRPGLATFEAQALPTIIRRRVVEATELRANHVVVLEPGTLPRTSSGKLRRGTTLTAWLEGQLTGVLVEQSWPAAGSAQAALEVTS